MKRPPDGVLLVDKPAGESSHAVVARVGRLLGVYPPRRGRRFRVGHAGALDPAATGLLVLLLGKATRLSGALLGHDKVYLARIAFGRETSTLDAEGETTATAPRPRDVSALTAALDGLTGEQLQTPPLYSSLKRRGVALHRRARAGEEIEEPAPRRVVVHSLELVEVAEAAEGQGIAAVTVRVHCSGGTYVRSLARDLGRRLDSAAHLAGLRREAVGALRLEGAVPLDALTGRDEVLARLLPAADALPDWPRLLLSDAEAVAVARGGQPAAAWLSRLTGPPAPAGDGTGRFLMHDADGTLLATGVVPVDRAGLPVGPPRLQSVLADLAPPPAAAGQEGVP